MTRLHQIVLITSALALSWLMMMVFHELGHVLNAWLSGGQVTKVVLHPLAISRTDVAPNPHPLVVVWGGAMWGCMLPLVTWALSKRVTRSELSGLRFFVGLCLIANGAYLAADAVVQAGDGNEMIRHGCPIWVPIIVGVPLVVAGLALWHGLGRSFGIGKDAGPVEGRSAWLVLAALTVVVLTEILLSHRA